MTDIDTKALALRVAFQANFAANLADESAVASINIPLSPAEARALAAFLREAVEGWIFDVASIPRDDTVLVCVEPTEKNNTRKRDRSVLPAYVDEDGRFCDSGTWKPDPGLQGEYWRTVAWCRFPLPTPAGEG